MSRGSRALDAHLDAADGAPPAGRHRPPAPPRFEGGRPLDLVVSRRVAGSGHWHLVTYGLSEMEFKETADRAVSGWGFELTIRLPPGDEPLWAVDLLNSLAAYVWTSGHPFAPGHHLDLRGPIRLGERTAITAAAVVEDPTVEPLDGPFGRVGFMQLVGLTGDELEACRAWGTEAVLDLLAEEDPMLLTRLDRRSLLDDPERAAALRAHAGPALTELRVGTLRLRRLLGGRARLTLGAGAAVALGPALRRQLHDQGASFTVVGDDTTARFSVEAAPSWRLEADGLVVAVPLGKVDRLAALFSGRTGRGRLAELPGLRFEVVA